MAKGKVIPQERRDFRSDRCGGNRPRKDFGGESRPLPTQAVNALFREPVSRIFEKIKEEPYFMWPTKMIGDPAKRNQNLYCHYHQERGHVTEQCRDLRSHLQQLVGDGRLKQFLAQPGRGENHTAPVAQCGAHTRPPLGTIHVILAAPGRTGSRPSRVMSIVGVGPEVPTRDPKRARMEGSPALSFSDADKAGTIQPHDDALVVTLRIGGYDVKRVLVDQGSGAEIMYPDLYKGLNLRPEDLTSYDSPLVGFDGKVVIPRGQIKLPVQAGSRMVEVDFIVVDAYSPYTAILARPWLHALGAVSSTLHLKVKYPSGDRVEELVGSQAMARQCLVAAITHQVEPEPTDRAGGEL